MVCLKASEEQMDQLLVDNEGVAFYDSDLPHIKHTAIAFRPVTRKQGGSVFGHLSLA